MNCYKVMRKYNPQHTCQWPKTLPCWDGWLGSKLLLTLLSLLNIVVGVLEKLCNDRLNVLSHVSSLGKGGTVTYSEGNVQTPSQGLGQQGLAWNRTSHAQKSTCRHAFQMVAFSPLARIWGECSTVHSPPALFFFFFFEVKIGSRIPIPFFMPG